MRNLLKNKKAQSTLEYILLVTAVVAVLIIFLNPTTGVFVTTVNQALEGGTNQMANMTGRLVTSLPTQ